MATFVPVHAAGDGAWAWHLTEAELRKRGHDVVAIDLPAGDPALTLADYADAVVDAVGDRTNLVVIGHSFGAFTAPLICERVHVDVLVLLNAMIPKPGEKPDDWWTKTAWAPFGDEAEMDDMARYYHDVEPELAAEALRRERDHPSLQSGREPWPLEHWPDAPTRVLAARDDRLFPLEFQRRIAKERLGIEPDEIEGGHTTPLSHPAELADRLVAYWREVST